MSTLKYNTFLSAILEKESLIQLGRFCQSVFDEWGYGPGFIADWH